MTTSSRGMKISRHFREFYDEMEPRYRSLEPIVSEIVKSLIKPRWHYECRIKQRESFALKIETARYKHPDQVDDILAGTIVVENSKAIELARNKVSDHFKVIDSRPQNPKVTHQRPETFEFDDLRLYLALPEDNPHYYSFRGLVFELQIKTFLQHAWGIATHDLTYKGDAVDWSLLRIAFQVKAMLEHAEASIEAAGQMAAASCLSKSNCSVDTRNSCVDLIKAYWDDEQLPFDVKRLASNILTALKVFDKCIDELDTLLAHESHKTAGNLALNLSPYLATVQVLLNECKTDRLAISLKHKSLKIVATPDIEPPLGVDLRKLRNVIFVDSSTIHTDNCCGRVDLTE